MWLYYSPQFHYHFLIIFLLFLTNYGCYQLKRSPMLYELTYYSVAGNNIKRDEVLRILEISRENNREHKITGCLVYHNDQFAQILEGDKQSVNDLYKKIEKDTRHTCVTLITMGEISQRAFNSWTMAFCDLKNTDELGDKKNYFEQNILKFSQVAKKPTFANDAFWSSVKSLVSNSKTSR